MAFPKGHVLVFRSASPPRFTGSCIHRKTSVADQENEKNDAILASRILELKSVASIRSSISTPIPCPTVVGIGTGSGWQERRAKRRPAWRSKLSHSSDRANEAVRSAVERASGRAARTDKHPRKDSRCEFGNQRASVFRMR